MCDIKRKNKFENHKNCLEATRLDNKIKIQKMKTKFIYIYIHILYIYIYIYIQYLKKSERIHKKQ